MKSTITYFLIICALSFSCCKTQKNITAIANIASSSTIIQDDYQYLEKDTGEVFLDFVMEENTNYLSTFDLLPQTDTIVSYIKNVSSKNVSDLKSIKITNKGEHYYLKKLNDSEEHVLFKKENYNSDEKIVFNPNERLPKGEKIVYINPSWDGSKIALGISKDNTDDATIIILDLPSNALLDYEFKNSKPNVLGGVEWLPDNNGIIYTYIPVLDSQDEDYRLNSEVRLYSWQKGNLETKILFSKEIIKSLNYDINNKDFPIAEISLGYLLCEVANTDRNRDTYFMRLEDVLNGKKNWRLLWDKEEKIKSYQISENLLFFLSSKSNQFYDVCTIDLTTSNPIQEIKTLYRGNEINIVEEIEVVNADNIFIVTMKNGIEANILQLDSSSASNIDLSFQAGRIDLSKSGTGGSDLWIEAEGWTEPRQRLHYNIETKAISKADLLENDLLNLNYNLELEEKEIPARDGELIPLSIIYKKGLKFDKPTRLIMGAYGSYGFTYSPRYYTFLHKWYDAGGVFAIAHVRGGGEKGQGWHSAGKKETKSNTWNDIIDCSEYLINKGYTEPDKLVLYGVSAGGIALGRAITERPELYKAATIIVGSLNISRMVDYPSGRNAIAEFGDPNNEIEKKYLEEMDPYLHIKNGKKYPALFLTGGMQDQRVRPWQPAKFGAKIRKCSISDNPVLIKIDTDGGHGARGIKFRRELAEIVSFSLWQTGHPDYQPISN